MSNEPGGPAPLPDPYATPGGHRPDPGPVPPPPSGFEAVLPPAAPYAASAPGAPSAASAPAYGYSEAGPSGTVNPFSPPSAFAAPVSPYGSPPPISPYGQAPGSGPAPTYGQGAGPGPSPTYPPAPTYPQAPAYGQAPSYGQAPLYGSGASYGQPAYGQGPPPPYGATPYDQGYPSGAFPSTATEPLSIAALVTSLAGIAVVISYPVGLGLGIAALRRIRTNGKQGRGMAIAGVVVGAIGTAWLLAIAAFVIAMFAGGGVSTFDDQTVYSSGTERGGNAPADADPNDTTLQSYSLRTDLDPGSCLDAFAAEPDMSDTAAVDCSVEHAGEVVSVERLSAPTGSDLSVDDPVWDATWDQCVSEAEAVLPADYGRFGQLELYTPHPDDYSSADGDKAYCTFFTDSSALTGSAVAHTLTLGTGGMT